MSNLSDLLPSGGGQNIVEFTADGAISAGDPVSLETNGKVKKITSANGNLARFIGLADAAISDTATGKINVLGSINSKQSSLTIGSDYNVNSAGSLTTSTTKPYFAVGKAVTATTINIRDEASANYVPVDPGQNAYTTNGSYTWVAPAGVTSVSVVAVGRGANMQGDGSGGGGGGLGYLTAYSVTPGNSYAVVLENSESTFNSPALRAYSATSKTGGSYVGDGGSSGGTGGTSSGSNYRAGGGGAAGYSGNGGNGGSNAGNGSAAPTGGGGGGGGGASTQYKGGGGGGGVGILGEGSSGTGGTAGSGSNNGTGGTGGSSGTTGSTGSGNNGGAGGVYGGGSGGGGGFGGGTSQGAVRIIWGANRAYPSTNTEDQ
jgi:hypothetical protein